MGFVYNNVWESFCKTYMELNGYFVLTNTFISLLDEEENDARRRRLEADLIATKLPNTNLGIYFLDRSRHPVEEDQSLFFAGADNAESLVYGEVRANLSVHNDQQLVSTLFEEDLLRINRKITRIEERFNTRPLVVIFAYRISKANIRKILDHGWKYKTFPEILKFMRERFQVEMIAKRRVQYNDPWLEFMRMLNRLELDQRLADCMLFNPDDLNNP